MPIADCPTLYYKDTKENPNFQIYFGFSFEIIFK